METLSPGRLPSSGLTADRRRLIPRLSRYDRLLAVVPIASVPGLPTAEVAGVPIRVSLAGAAGIGGLAPLEALFLNPPKGQTPGDA